MILLYIENNLVDLFPGTKIAISLQRNDVLDLSTRYTTFTNQIKIPKTPNNISIIGLQSDKSYSSSVYSKLECKLVINGYECISYGVALINKIDDSINVQIYDNLIDVFDPLKSLNTSDLYTFGSPIAWSDAGADSARNNTTGHIFALGDFGKRAGKIFLIPLFFYHDIIREILEFIGVESSDINTYCNNDTDVTSLVYQKLPSTLEYKESIGEVYNCKYEMGSGFSFGAGVSDIKIINMDTLVSAGTRNFYDSANDQYDAVDYVRLYVIFTIVSASIESAGIGEPFLVELVRDRGGVITVIASDTYLVTVGPVSLNGNYLDATIELEPGDLVYARFSTDGGGGTVFGSFSDCTYEFISTQQVYTQNTNFDYLKASPISAYDFLKDFTVRFGVLYTRSDSGTVRIKRIKEILEERQNAVDWTNKYVNTDESNYKSKYRKNNYFEYSNQPILGSIGRGNLEAINSSDMGSYTIYKSPFNGCDSTTYIYTNLCYIPYYDSTSVDLADPKNELPLTLLTIRDKLSFETPYVFDSASRTDYSVAYFVNNSLSKDTGFQYFVDNYYEIFNESINNHKLETRFYNLTEKDIFEYDPFKMIYDNGDYFLINKIENFVPGQITKVELLRI